jgi:hypothetical protein
VPADRRPRDHDRHLASSPTFIGADPAAIDEIERAMETIRLEAGGVLVRHGEAADRVYIVFEGHLTIALESGRPGGDQLLLGRGDLLVDGGLLDTLPVGVMRQLNGGGRVVAVDVAPPVDVAASQDFGNHLSGWRLLRERVHHPRTSRGIPGIFELLSRTVAVTGLFLERQLRRRVPPRSPPGRTG